MDHREEARLVLETVGRMASEFEKSLKEGEELYNTIAKDEEPTHVKNFIVGRVIELENAINKQLDMLWKLAYGTENPKKISVATEANKKRMELRQLAVARAVEAAPQQESPQLIKVPQQVPSK